MTQEGFKRKLAAILSADVEGYSRLMGDDEEATVRTLTAYREVLTTLIQQHNGKVLDSPGDNLLAEFVSVVDAVQCAVAVQKEIKARNDQLPENRKMQFRIGINLGDVIQEEERIYGDGVNIAARLESLANPGGICISKTAFDQIESKLPYGYEFLGDQTVKNIAKPVSAYRVLMEPRVTVAGVPEKEKRSPVRRMPILIGAAAVLVLAVAMGIWQFYMHRPAVEPASVEKMAFPLPKEPSIAVMPFENLSGDSEQDYIADGISENIMTALSKISEIFVIARNSTFTYKGKAVRVQQVAEDLGVRYVLEGSVQKFGTRLRVTAQLVDALTGRHLWAEQYGRDMKDLFALLDEITHEVVVALQIKLTHGEQARVWAKGTDNLEAWGYFSKGMGLLWRFTKEDNAMARESFERAVRIDPKYALAWAYLAWTHWMELVWHWSDSDKESRRRMNELARKVLALDDSIPEAHALLGLSYRVQGQFDKAIAEGEKAIILGTNHAGVHASLAYLMHFAGRPEEAISLIRKAMRLHPYYPAIYIAQLALSLHQAGRYEEALASWEQLLDRTQKGEFPSKVAHFGLTVTYLELGRNEEARTHAAELLRLEPAVRLETLGWEAKTYFGYKDLAYVKQLFNPLNSLQEEVHVKKVYVHGGMPAFKFEYPEGSKAEPPDTINEIVEMQIPGGGSCEAFVSDIPNDMSLEDVGPEIFTPALEKAGSNANVTSNEAIMLNDSTKAYKTEFEWLYRDGQIWVRSLIVSAFKEVKWVALAVHTAGDPNEIAWIAESLTFNVEPRELASAKLLKRDIPIFATIYQLNEADSSVRTSIEVIIGESFPGKLPDDIGSIRVTVTDSDGNILPLTLPAYTYIKQFRDFWYTLDEPPALGKYTFTVKSKGSTGTATDFQQVNRTIPLPDVSIFSPGQGEILTSRAPTFSWGAVKYPDIPIYYRLVIDEHPSRKRVFSTGRVRDMLSYNVSEGLLKSGQTYRWQIRIEDSHDWVKMQNRSSSEWLTFTMAKSLE